MPLTQKFFCMFFFHALLLECVFLFMKVGGGGAEKETEGERVVAS